MHIAHNIINNKNIIKYVINNKKYKCMRNEVYF